MKEHTHLIAEHDVRVALCIVQNGHDINWGDKLPDEVLYIPEEVFDVCAPQFIKRVGDRYYGTTGLTPDLLEPLELDSATARSASDLNVRTAAAEIARFLERGKALSASHYLAFEGP